jgi:16S rRNA (uracil1498-N3)-methyltransferase
MPKPERVSWLVEKVTEIGVCAIRFVSSERAPRELGDNAIARLRRVAASAVEQCHRARLPEVSGVHEWAELWQMSGRHELKVVLEASGAMPDSALGAGPASAALLVGPEGGWTAGELAQLDAQGWVRHRLGARTLRTETAAIAGAAWLLQGKD